MKTVISNHLLTNLESDIKSQIIDILDDYYLSPKSLFEYLLTSNSNVYILESDSKVIGFYMYGIKVLNELTFLHLGQCCIRKEHSNKNHIRLLLSHQVEDLPNLNLPKDTIIYATTANEAIFNYSFSIYKNVSPSLNGDYSINDINSLEKLQSLKTWKPCSTHPFLIRNCASVSRYKSSVPINQEDTFFSKLNIKEQNGDRLVFILSN